MLKFSNKIFALTVCDFPLLQLWISDYLINFKKLANTLMLWILYITYWRQYKPGMSKSLKSHQNHMELAQPLNFTPFHLPKLKFHPWLSMWQLSNVFFKKWQCRTYVIDRHPVGIYLFRVKLWNLFRVINKDTRTKSMMSFCIFIVNFE